MENEEYRKAKQYKSTFYICNNTKNNNTHAGTNSIGALRMAEWHISLCMGDFPRRTLGFFT
jgi:hypothetical protein